MILSTHRPDCSSLSLSPVVLDQLLASLVSPFQPPCHLISCKIRLFTVVSYPLSILRASFIRYSLHLFFILLTDPPESLIFYRVFFSLFHATHSRIIPSGSFIAKIFPFLSVKINKNILLFIQSPVVYLLLLNETSIRSFTHER